MSVTRPKRTFGKTVLVCAIAAFIVVAHFGVFPSAASAEPAGPDVTRFRVFFPLYLASGIYVYPVEYYVPHTVSPARSAIEALIAGLPDNAGYRFVSIPKTTRVLGLTIQNQVCTVDFSEDIRQVNVGSGGEAALVNAIVNTLAQFPTVDRVNILVGGQPAETLAGHVDITGSLEPGGDIFRGFEDAGQHWAGGAVMVLQSMDILVGYEDGTFRPDRQLSRAEFLKMLVEVLLLPDVSSQSVPFTDLEGHWSRSYVQRALASGVITAADYGQQFNPDGIIPREEMAYLLVSARESYVIAHPNVTYPVPSTVTAFADVSEIEARYRDRVRECAELGLLEGYPGGKFAPKRGLTRGEAATVLARLMGMRGAGTMVVVSSPKPGSNWKTGRFIILGAASAFEGTVNYRLLGANRTALYENYTTSTMGMGWGAVGVSIDTSLLTSVPELLEVYMVSMMDGSDISVTGIPLER